MKCVCDPDLRSFEENAFDDHTGVLTWPHMKQVNGVRTEQWGGQANGPALTDPPVWKDVIQ